MKRESYAVSLRKTKKKERIFTKRSAYYGRQIRGENLTNNPEEEVDSPTIMELINLIISGKCTLLYGLTQIEQHMHADLGASIDTLEADQITLICDVMVSVIS
jgi:hypothetical protein